eukprot:GDKI01044686.1.p1 GENE.GDKI01044686.1~~GDKI01044686.1.p1  ORF type:complete len:325 (+),score=104.86 GDKI01044686.1:50-976(+)
MIPVHHIARPMSRLALAPVARHVYPAARRTFFTVVNQAEIAYREFLGGNRIRLEPGLRMNLPFLHTIHRVDTRESMIDVPVLQAYTRDNVPVKISGTLFFKAHDAEKACYGVTDYTAAVSAAGESTLRAVVGRFEFDDIIGDRNRLNEELVRVLGDSLKEWGTVCTRCEVQHFGPQDHQVAAQLQKQLEAERRRRENELDTQAAVRTAEGAKQEAVLRSEGELIAAQNRSKALQYEMNVHATALAEQVAAIGKVTGCSETAVRLLLEHKRLQHLAEISKRDNRVYFLSPEGAYPSAAPPVADLIREGK